MEGAYLPYSVNGYFANGGGRCYVISVNTLGASTDPDRATLAQATLPGAGEAEKDSLLLKASQGGPAGNNIGVTIKIFNRHVKRNTASHPQDLIRSETSSSVH